MAPPSYTAVHQTHTTNWPGPYTAHAGLPYALIIGWYGTRCARRPTPPPTPTPIPTPTIPGATAPSHPSAHASRSTTAPFTRARRMLGRASPAQSGAR